MTKILLNGYQGKMGHVISDLAASRKDVKIIAGVDHAEPNADNPFPGYASYADVKEKPDVLIDFSNPKALDNILAYCISNKVPAIICTTGFSDDQVKQIHAAAEQIPVFFSSNMSIGVNLLVELAKSAAKVLYPGFNIEIVEEHHNQKLDAPSGTALMIANEISSVLNDDISYEYDREAKREKRPVNEIGIHSVRAGTIVGEHEVIFGGPDEVLKITHTAYSRKIFANGALNAAVFMAQDRKPGLYSMKDLLA